jgi:hypothetical protein
MTEPIDLSHLPIDTEALQRLHRVARLAARRLAPPSDPLLAEYIDELGVGRARPRDLLLSGHYADAIEPLLQRAAATYAELTLEERAELIAEGTVEMGRLLDEQERRHGGKAVS